MSLLTQGRQAPITLIHSGKERGEGASKEGKKTAKCSTQNAPSFLPYQ